MNAPRKSAWTSSALKIAAVIVTAGLAALLVTTYFADDTPHPQQTASLPRKPTRPRRTARGEGAVSLRIQIPRVNGESEFLRGKQAFDNGWIGLAEQSFRRALRLNPASSQFRVRLGQHLFWTGRVFAARQILEPLLKDRGMDPSTLAMMGNSELTFESESKTIQQGLADSPDQATILANVHWLIVRQDFEAANRLLEQVLETPDGWTDQFKTLRARYLQLTGQQDELSRWLANPDAQPSVSDPDYLTIKGRLLRTNNHLADAMGCFARAFQLDPIHLAATSQLAEMFEEANQPAAAAFFRRRAKRISEYQAICDRIHQSDRLPDRPVLESAIQACCQLNLLREAKAWSKVAQVLEPDSDWMLADNDQRLGETGSADGRFSGAEEFLHWLDGSNLLFLDR